MELQQNEAYIKTPAIPVGANECYGTTTSTSDQQQDMELQQNQAYIQTPAIPVGTNECYGATTSTSVNPDQLYATPTKGGVTHTPSQLQESAIEEYDYVI